MHLQYLQTPKGMLIKILKKRHLNILIAIYNISMKTKLHAHEYGI
jgi:hypothetical protein